MIIKMSNINFGRGYVYSIQYHIVWCVKYRRYIQTQKERWEGETMVNYVLTLALKTELWQEHILEKRLNIARMIYNSCLSEILKRHRKMINSSEYKGICNLDKKEQSKRYKELDKKYLISKFELNKYVKPMTQKFNMKSLLIKVIILLERKN